MDVLLRGRLLLALGLVWLAAMGRPDTAAAQPAWQAAVASAPGVYGSAITQATVADASGNVYVVGYFGGSVRFGSTVLATTTVSTNSSPDNDIFVAKWNTVSNSWVWALRAGGVYDDRAVAVALSGSSLYLTGTCTSTATFGSQTVTVAAGTCNYVAKVADFGAGGAFDWVRGANAGNLETSSIAVSGSSIYVAGKFRGTSVFDGVTLTSNNADYTDAFVLKFTDNGRATVAVWGQRGNSQFGDAATSVAASGNYVYLAGSFTSATATFGSTTLTTASPGYSDGFVARLTDAGTAGAFAWAQRLGGGYDDRLTTVLASGTAVYVAGKLGNAPTATLGPFNNLEATLNLFVLRLDDVGSMPAYTWVRQCGGGSVELAGLALSGSSLYVAGNTFNGSVPTRFGSISLTNPGTLYDAFVARLDDAGASASFAWAKLAGGTSTETPTGVAASSAGAFVVGTTSSSRIAFGTAAGSPLYTGADRFLRTSSFVAALSPAGDWQAAQGPFIGGLFTVTSVAADACGLTYVAGTFTGQVELGSTLLGSLGYTDVFVAKWNPAGSNWSWAVRAGGEAGDYAPAIATSSNGNRVYLVGTMASSFQNQTTPSTAEFGSIVLTNSNTAGTDAFVARLTDTGTTGVFDWAQGLGSTGDDELNAVAVSGSSVYVAGRYSSLYLNVGATRLANAGGFDLMAAKLTDTGTAATYNWALSAGANYNDNAASLALSGSSVYVAGTLTNPFKPNLQPDVWVGKIADAGSTAAFNWTQLAVGTSYAGAASVAVRGSNVYVGGYFTSTSVAFGSLSLANTSTTNPTQEGFVARLTDNGAAAGWTWAQRIGGSGAEVVNAVAVSGNAVYAGGSFSSVPATFGSTQVSGAVGSDGFLTRLTDYGATTTFDWVQRTGGPGGESIGAVVATGNQLVVGGAFAGSQLALGGLSLPGAASAVGSPPAQAFAARLTDPVYTSPAAFSYPAASYCRTGPTPTPLVPGTAGGTFSATPAGLALNATTGAIDPAASAPGTYTVTYALPGGVCAPSSSQQVTITAPASATFSYAAAAYCAGAAPVAPTVAAGATAGTFSSSSGLALNASTGQVTPAGSAPGTYTITNTVAASSSCGAATATTTLTVNPAPATPTITVTGTPATGVTLTSSAAAGNQFYLNGVAIPGATGQSYVVLSGAGNGQYTVVVTGTNGCASAASAASSVTVTATTPAAARLALHPNPTPDGYLLLDLGSRGVGTQLTVRSLLGQLLWQGAGQASPQTLDLSALPAGVYLLQLRLADGSTETHRVVRH